MSYAIGTQLSYNDGKECATVLRANRVLITKSEFWTSKTVTLDDWMPSLEQHTVQEEFIPVPHEQKPVVMGPDEEYPVGTVFKWFMNSYRYCIAVQEANGVRQVEDAFPGASFGQLDINYGEVVFDDFDAWKESIPKKWLDDGVFCATRG